jgi:predicted nucleotidyltransferase
MTRQTYENENIREHLLSYVGWFVEEAAKLTGVRRIALLGSITTEKKDPKDIDFVVTVDDDVDLEPLARWEGSLRDGRNRLIVALIFFWLMFRGSTSGGLVTGPDVDREYGRHVMR